MTPNASYKICGTAVESTNHILKYCNRAVTTWCAGIKKEMRQHFFNCNFKVWLVTNIIVANIDVHGSKGWPSLFGCICWKIWSRKNKFVFNSKMGQFQGILVRSY